MSKRRSALYFLLTACMTTMQAQVFQELDANGNVSQSYNADGTTNGNFNPNRRDSAKITKVIPRGVHVWTIDRRFGDVRPAEVDTMLVIGSRQSSNTQKLYEICRKECENTYYIQTPVDLDSEMFHCGSYVGITAGASTPKKIIEEVQEHVRIKF